MASKEDMEEVSKHKKQKETVPGVIYLSRVPPFMSVKKIRDVFGQYGDLGRIFLQPDGKNMRKNVKMALS